MIVRLRRSDLRCAFTTLHDFTRLDLIAPGLHTFTHTHTQLCHATRLHYTFPDWFHVYAAFILLHLYTHAHARRTPGRYRTFIYRTHPVAALLVVPQFTQFVPRLSRTILVYGRGLLRSWLVGFGYAFYTLRCRFTRTHTPHPVTHGRFTHARLVYVYGCWLTFTFIHTLDTDYGYTHPVHRVYGYGLRTARTLTLPHTCWYGCALRCACYPRTRAPRALPRRAVIYVYAFTDLPVTRFRVAFGCIIAFSWVTVPGRTYVAAVVTHVYGCYPTHPFTVAVLVGYPTCLVGYTPHGCPGLPPDTRCYARTRTQLLLRLRGYWDTYRTVTVVVCVGHPRLFTELPDSADTCRWLEHG